jgi:septal ring factor EnvC (AmiA/AmiB activator)
MGFIWDLIQHGQIERTQQGVADAQQRAATLEQRVQRLEMDLQRTNETLVKLLRGLETRFGQDLDGDNRVG